VGLGGRGLAEARDARGARLVLDDDRRLELGFYALGEGTGGDVGGATGCVGHDQGDVALGEVGLSGACAAGRGGTRARGEGEGCRHDGGADEGDATADVHSWLSPW